MKVKVSSATQVNTAEYGDPEGRVFGEGETLELPDEAAERLVEAGIVAKVGSRKKGD